jgi:MFS family permease
MRSSKPDGQPQIPISKKERRVEILLFILLLGCFVYFFPPWADWSQNSRLNLTLAIVDEGTLSIDSYVGNTGDYAFFEGRYYLDKAPGPSFLAVPVYAAVRPILLSAPMQNVLVRIGRSAAFEDTLNEEGTGLRTDKIYFATVLLIVTFVTISIPSTVLGVLIFRFLRYLNLQAGWAAIVALIYGLATNAFPYSGAFFSHQLVAFLLFGAFYLAFLIKGGKLHPAWSILTGFMLGYALISEYPTFLIALAVFVYTVLSLKDKRWVAAFIAGGIPPGLMLMIYNWLIFRTPLPVGYRYSELYVEQHSVGLISLTYPKLDALWGITFSSYRGLFFVSPVLLLAVLGLVLWLKWGKYRREAMVCIWAALIFILFNASSVMWQGGYSIGPRYLLPMLPFLVTGIGVFAMQFGDRLWARLVIGLLSLLSVFVVWAQSLGGQNFPDWTENPLFNYSIPHLLNANIARNWGMALGLSGWMSLVPLLLFIMLMIILLVRPRLSLSKASPVQRGGSEAKQN